MASARRPSHPSRTASTPPSSPPTGLSVESKLDHGHESSSVLTPPTSPRQSRSASNISQLAAIGLTPCAQHQESPAKLKDIRLDPIQTNVPANRAPSEPVVAECPFEIKILKDDRGQDAIFGKGAWSIVYKATTYAKSTKLSAPLTPPLSPTVVTPLLVAVKQPARRDAFAILKSEAQILTYLHTVQNCDDYVVLFYGIVDDTSLVLEAIPFSLEDHIRRCASSASKHSSTWAVTEPALGSTSRWLHLAQQLISALVWLQDEAQVVHGDIKPGNILLSRLRGSGLDVTFDPVFADFSSSQRLDLDETTPNTLSAVTREYTAPELLNSKVLRDPTSTATTASDVFSLAITLLVAATGQMMVYPGSVFQRQAMATQGWLVLGHARNGEGGSRVPRFGIVEKVLERAVLKAGMGRVNASGWKEIVQTISKVEPAKI